MMHGIRLIREIAPALRNYRFEDECDAFRNRTGIRPMEPATEDSGRHAFLEAVLAFVKVQETRFERICERMDLYTHHPP